MKNTPNTLEEAVDLLISKIPAEQQELAKKMSKNEFIGSTHMFLGMSIRNEWNLWYNETPLTEYFSSLGINHGDDRSGMILESVYRKLTGQNIDLVSQVNRYKEHWMEAGFPDGIHPPIERTK